MPRHGVDHPGAGDEALDVADDLLAAAETTDNPCEKIWALMGYGMVRWNFNGRARQDFDAAWRSTCSARRSDRARERQSTTREHIRRRRGFLAAARGDPMDAFDLFALAIRYYYDAGSFSHMHSPLAWLATFFDHSDTTAPAATIAGFADDFYYESLTRRSSTPRLPTCAKVSASKPTNHSLGQAQA